MKILGINHDMYISSAALLNDGEVIAACSEERLSREKRSRAFPANAARFCLKQGELTLEDVDCIANGYNPAVHLQKYNPIYSKHRRFRGDYLYSVQDHLFGLLKDREKQHPEFLLQQVPLSNGNTLNTYYVTHHLCHAANAFYLSPFEEAAILTADGRGEQDTVVFAIGRGANIDVLKRMIIPQSLGTFYSAFTAFLGFKPDGDEWKVMALSSFADWNNSYYEKIRSLVALKDDGTFEIDLTYFKEFVHETVGHYSQKLIDLVGPERDVDDDYQERHFQIASAMQRVTEETFTHMLTWLARETGMSKVCVGGGMFMNSVYNGRIRSETPFDDVFISSCPDDSGLSIGAALYINHHVMGNVARHAQTHNYYGPSYTNDEVEATLSQYKLTYRRADDVEREVAELLSEGKLVGWFQGKMEFGQRALGNRSIIADPRREEMKDKINAAVKFREAFRPFAPAILEERVKEYFDIEPGVKVPFMEKVYPVSVDKRNIIPAVTHTDGSGRLQTVSKETNPRFYGLIKHFEDITGVPIILNTSFNLNGEPVVCSPTDAIRTFNSCGMDALVLNDFIITK